MKNDELSGWEPKDEVFLIKQSKVIAIIFLIAVLALTIYMILTAGCITMATKEYHVFVDTPTPTPTPAPHIEPTATPTPEPTLPYNLWKYTAKQFNLSEWYTIERLNVSGRQNMVLKTTIYRIKQMPNYYTWEWNWGGPTDGSADWANVPDEGNKFVFVWVCQYLDGQNQTYDPQIWSMDENHISLEINGKIYENKNREVDLTAPIREFENIYDLSNTSRTGPYARKRVQNIRSGIITADDPAWLRMGRSNAQDGWVLFEVPREADISKAIIHMDFMALGKRAYWTVTPGYGYFK